MQPLLNRGAFEVVQRATEGVTMFSCLRAMTRLVVPRCRRLQAYHEHAGLRLRVRVSARLYANLRDDA
jgi:hypothetical protein